MLRLLDSRFVPKLKDVYVDDQHIHIVQQVAGKRTLKEFLQVYKNQLGVGG